jgi:hypothetical protein
METGGRSMYSRSVAIAWARCRSAFTLSPECFHDLRRSIRSAVIRSRSSMNLTTSSRKRCSRLAVEVAAPQEVPAEQLRDREDEPDVGHLGEDLLDHSLRPQESTLLAQAKEAEVRVATAGLGFQEIPNPGMHRAVGPTEPFIVEREEIVELILDEFLELVGAATRPFAHSGGDENRDEAWRRRSRPEGARRRAEEARAGLAGGKATAGSSRLRSGGGFVGRGAADRPSPPGSPVSARSRSPGSLTRPQALNFSPKVLVVVDERSNCR